MGARARSHRHSMNNTVRLLFGHLFYLILTNQQIEAISNREYFLLSYKYDDKFIFIAVFVGLTIYLIDYKEIHFVI